MNTDLVKSLSKKTRT